MDKEQENDILIRKITVKNVRLRKDLRRVNDIHSTLLGQVQRKYPLYVSELVALPMMEEDSLVDIEEHNPGAAAPNLHQVRVPIVTI